MRPRSPQMVRGLTAAAAITLAAGLGVAVAGQASAAAGCRVDYTANQWSTGFTADVKITNLGDPISNGWNLTWSFAGNQRITDSYFADFASQLTETA